MWRPTGSAKPSTNLAIAAVFSLASTIGLAQSADTFTATGDMVTPRTVHTATLLPDGKVLIAGGEVDGNIFSPTNSAELYDPSTGTFSATGSMTTARYEHTATLLPDGRVLIAAGGDGSGRLALSAELYDPSTGTFTATGNMATGHWRATLLSSGKVLMGLPATDVIAEIYDPSTGEFTAAGSGTDPAIGVIEESATLLPDGKVLTSADSPPEVYDPAVGTFSPTGMMIYPDAVVERSATLLASGKVVFAGGESDDGKLYPNAELYDPSAGNFAATGSMAEPRKAHAATLLPDGRVLITGGDLEMATRGTYQSAELYDAASGTFSSAGNMTMRRSYHAATLLKDGRVLITGGDYISSLLSPRIIPSNAELYTPTVLVPAPLLFSVSGDGKGQGAVWHATTGQIASPDNPAALGEILSMYTNGLVEDGLIPPQIIIGNQLAETLFFGDAPGYPGYYQVNFRVPMLVVPGPATPVRLTYLNRSSNQITIGIQ